MQTQWNIGVESEIWGPGKWIVTLFSQNSSPGLEIVYFTCIAGGYVAHRSVLPKFLGDWVYLLYSVSQCALCIMPLPLILITILDLKQNPYLRYFLHVSKGMSTQCSNSILNNKFLAGLHFKLWLLLDVMCLWGHYGRITEKFTVFCV